MNADDDATFLASAPERWRVLVALRDEPGSPATLADRLSISRRTIQRHLRAFEDRNWTKKVDGAHRLSTIGQFVARTHADYLDSIQRIDEYAPLLEHVSDAEFAPDPAWLADATLEAATPENPQAPVRFYVERVRDLDADRVRMLSPVLSRLYHDAHADLAKRGTHTELVLPAAAVDRAREENPLEFRAVLGLGVLTLYRTTDAVDLGLTLTDDRVLVCAYGDDGQLAACVDVTDDRVLAWATDVYERYRDDATKIEPPGAGPFGRRD